MVTHPAPPQTRTCAMHAYGSSSRAATALLQSPGVLWSGLVSSMSLPYVPPADALLDGAFPPVGFPLDNRLRDILFVHDSTHFGAHSRGLCPRYTRLRTAPYGEARGFAPDRLARRSSGRT